MNLVDSSPKYFIDKLALYVEMTIIKLLISKNNQYYSNIIFYISWRNLWYMFK